MVDVEQFAFSFVISCQRRSIIVSRWSCCRCCCCCCCCSCCCCCCCNCYRRFRFGVLLQCRCVPGSLANHLLQSMDLFFQIQFCLSIESIQLCWGLQKVVWKFNWHVRNMTRNRQFCNLNRESVESSENILPSDNRRGRWWLSSHWRVSFEDHLFSDNAGKSNRNWIHYFNNNNKKADLQKSNLKFCFGLPNIELFFSLIDLPKQTVSLLVKFIFKFVHFAKAKNMVMK